MSRDVRLGRILLVVASVIAVRVLAVSLILPVFSPYGRILTDSDALVGIALGGYGITMALMQIPLGVLSDRWGRKPVLVLGSVVFVVGSVIAAGAEPLGRATGVPAIWVLIFGRLVEGLGAVSSVGTALLADVAPEAKRTVTMAVAGIGAGLAFLVGIAVGPLLEPSIGVPGLFLLAGGLGLVLMVALLFVIPPGLVPVAGPAVRLRSVLSDARALRVDAAGLVMNFTLIATMFALPLFATRELGTGTYRWMLVAAVSIGGILAIGASRRADQARRVRRFAAVSALLIGVGSAALLTVDVLWLYLLVGIVYFGAHAAQSAALPSLVGRLFPGNRRGAAMGMLNTGTYLGSFLGGYVGAVLFDVDSLLQGVILGLGLLVALALGTLRLDAETAPS